MKARSMASDPKEAVTQLIIATPSLGAVVLGWLQAPLAEWQIRLGMAFIIIQAMYLLWKWRREAKQPPKVD